jgi:hypothetical protein
MKLFIYIFIFGTLLLGCSDKLNDNLLVGLYQFKTNKNDLIILNPNHTYVHKLIAADGQVFECTGNWEFDSSGNEVTFNDFSFFEGDNLPPGIWLSRVRVSNDNQIILMYSSENDLYYKKK